MVVSALRPFDVKTCARWHHVPATSTIDGPPQAVPDRYEAVVQLRPGESPDAAFERVRDRLFAYRVFPPRLMRFVICPEGCLREGSVVVQRVAVGPLRIEAAVRVVERWDRGDAEQRSAGFRYVTLAGHPECGVASFEVRLGADDRVTVEIESRSRPGGRATRAARPLARSVQRRSTMAALAHLTAA